jgi:ketosteroid isomerase-like protein
MAGEIKNRSREETAGSLADEELARTLLLDTSILFMEAIKEKYLADENSTREHNTETIRQFIHLIEQRNIPAVLDLFSDDAVQFNYFQCGMIPPEIRGKAALEEFWTPIPGKFREMYFPIEMIYPMLDPAQIAVKYQGHTKLKNSDKHYDNEYFALFFFNEEGRIKEYHEYSNPVVTAKSFDLVDKIL